VLIEFGILVVVSCCLGVLDDFGMLGLGGLGAPTAFGSFDRILGLAPFFFKRVSSVFAKKLAVLEKFSYHQ